MLWVDTGDWVSGVSVLPGTRFLCWFWVRGTGSLSVLCARGPCPFGVCGSGGLGLCAPGGPGPRAGCRSGGPEFLCALGPGPCRAHLARWHVRNAAVFGATGVVSGTHPSCSTQPAPGTGGGLRETRGKPHPDLAGMGPALLSPPPRWLRRDLGSTLRGGAESAKSEGWSTRLLPPVDSQGGTTRQFTLGAGDARPG